MHRVVLISWVWLNKGVICAFETFGRGSLLATRQILCSQGPLHRCQLLLTVMNTY